MAIEYTIISGDSHVIEPHDLWQRLVPEKFKERAPRLVHDTDTDRLECDMAQLPPVGLLAGCARGDDDVRWEGRWEEDVFVGGYDPKVRRGDMERDGVDAEVLYPTIAMQMYPIPDAEFQWALFKAYNTWLAEDFCAADPERFFGIAMLNHEDLDGAIAELERAKSIGLRGVMVPAYAGEDSPYADPAMDRLWAAAVANEMPVSLHAATSRDRSKAWNTGTPTDAVTRIVNVQRIILDMIFTGVFDRFPELMLVSAENDAGWAGNLIERADYNWHRNKNVRSKRYDGGICAEEPSTYFHRNVRLTFMRDRTAALAAEVIGKETLVWGSDFPHHVSTWPNSQTVLKENFAEIDPEVFRAATHDNVRALYHF
jgi:predicted TIM-barrel fold metal-dependent hydrolase